MARKVVKIAETTFLQEQQQQQQQQQKQYQSEIVSIHREEIPQLEVSMLNAELTNFKVEFQAGKTEQYLCNYKHLTLDTEILQTVSGLPIEITESWCRPTSITAPSDINQSLMMK